MLLWSVTACQDDFVYNTNNDEGANNATDMGDDGVTSPTEMGGGDPGEMGETTTGENNGPGMCPSERPTRCGDDCVDLFTDPTACGGCGTMCAVGEVCEQGQCTEQTGDCRDDGCTGLTWCDASDGQCKPGCAEGRPVRRQ